MKKVLVLLTITMIFALTACSGDIAVPTNETSGTTRNDTSGTTQTDTPTPMPSDDYEDYFEDDYHYPREDLSLSRILYDFTFILEGDTVTLPMTYDDFISLGWEPIWELNETIAGNTLGTLGQHEKNGRHIFVSVMNMSDTELPVNETLVVTISTPDIRWDDDNSAVIELPRGIILGVSTFEDVIAAFGYPTFLSDNSDDPELPELYLYYNHPDFRRGTWFGVDITTDSDLGNIVTQISISNSIEHSN